MKGLKLQIRIEPEMKERWQAEALVSHKTLTQYIVDKVEGTSNEVEGAGVIPEKKPVVKVSKKAPKEINHQTEGGHITYFK